MSIQASGNSGTRSSSKDSVDKNSTSAVGKAFAILRVLRRSAVPMTLSSIAQEIGMAPSSAHSVLNQLLLQGAVVQDPDKRYQLGPSTFFIGSAFARGTPIYRSIWMELVTAANDLGVTTALAVTWESHHLVLNSHRAGESDVAVPFGGRVPLFASSWGKVYSAWGDGKAPKELARFTPRSIVDRAKWAEEVEHVREFGYATDNEEFASGVGGVAAAVTSDLGYAGLASFLAPMEQVEELTFERLGRRIAALAARASHALGDTERMRFFGAD
jgi:DNA-binding IclR family transcriptional regulator